MNKMTREYLRRVALETTEFLGEMMPRTLQSDDAKEEMLRRILLNQVAIMTWLSQGKEDEE